MNRERQLKNMRKLENMKWWPELLRQKDSRTLRQLSETYGASPAAISAALRRHHGLAVGVVTAGVVTPDSDDDLPPEAGEELAEERPQKPRVQDLAVEPSTARAKNTAAAPRASAAAKASNLTVADPMSAATHAPAVAWKLLLTDGDATPRLVTATTLIEAAEIAMRARQDVVGLAWVGEVVQ